ncbi:MAG: hypothetical protein AABX23_00785 [Nanoarchaeota archaeon]
MPRKKRDFEDDPYSLQRFVDPYSREINKITSFGRISEDVGRFRSLTRLLESGCYREIYIAERESLREEKDLSSGAIYLIFKVGAKIKKELEDYRSKLGPELAPRLKQNLDDISQLVEDFNTRNNNYLNSAMMQKDEE